MPVEIFFCYAREDEALLNQLKIHLKPLQRQGIIEMWYDRDISAGAEWEHEIDRHLSTSKIILLLISPDFMNSDYCYGVEMRRAMERHEGGETCVIPIILRHVYWQVEPLSKLQVLPTDAKPVTDPFWHNLDIAFYNITEGIRKVAEGLVDFYLLGTVRGHSTRVMSVAFSPDGKMLASGSADGSIKLWQLSTENSVDAFNPKALGRISSIAFSPDGEILASGGNDFMLRLWNMSNGELITTLHNTSMINTIAISPSGKVLASGSFDKKVRLWSLMTKKLLRTLEGHTLSVMSVAFSPDGKMLASGSNDRSIKLWQSNTLKLMRTLIGHSDSILAVAFSPDGKMLASGSNDATIKLWHPHTGKQTGTLIGHLKPVQSVSIIQEQL